LTALSDKIALRATTLLQEAWQTTDGSGVPKTQDVALKNGAVKIDAAYLYADLAQSTLLQKRYKPEFAARVVRMYLAGACELIRAKGGSIKSFDGDRVMGIFVGDSMRNDAVDTALKINWYVDQVLNPQIKKRLESSNSTVWTVTHGIGIDSGPAFITRAGVHNRSGEHNHNDLVSIGAAPNIAAKLSGLRGPEAGPITITANIYSMLNDAQKKGGKPTRHMWGDAKDVQAGPHLVSVRQSGWRRTP
jgi:class 3 adenylate cyclase